jgi:hypothetical protein
MKPAVARDGDIGWPALDGGNADTGRRVPEEPYGQTGRRTPVSKA